jgi:hypothetical protein
MILEYSIAALVRIYFSFYIYLLRMTDSEHHTSLPTSVETFKFLINKKQNRTFSRDQNICKMTC